MKNNPGSPEAIRLGCECPKYDNAHGAGVPSADGPLFWTNGNCPMHGVKPTVSKKIPWAELDKDIVR